MDVRFEIVDKRVICKQDGAEAYSASLPDFLQALANRGESSCLPEPVPEGVRFIRRRGDGVVLVMEEKPQVRTVNWLADDSPVPYGPGAVYRTLRLAFPYILIVVALRGGALTGIQQCFYRTGPLEKLDDELLLSNLYNVSVNGYGQQCWLCLANLKADLASMSWNRRVSTIRCHFWADWNKSSDVHEGASYFTTMQKLDARIASLQAWEQASQADPLFPLKVAWKTSGRTLGAVVDQMLNQVAPPVLAGTAAELVQVLTQATGKGPRRLRMLLK